MKMKGKLKFKFKKSKNSDNLKKILIDKKLEKKYKNNYDFKR